MVFKPVEIDGIWNSRERHGVAVEPVKAVLPQAVPIVLRVQADPVDRRRNALAAAAVQRAIANALVDASQCRGTFIYHLAAFQGEGVASVRVEINRNHTVSFDSVQYRSPDVFAAGVDVFAVAVLIAVTIPIAELPQGF